MPVGEAFSLVGCVLAWSVSILIKCLADGLCHVCCRFALAVSKIFPDDTACARFSDSLQEDDMTF